MKFSITVVTGSTHIDVLKTALLWNYHRREEKEAEARFFMPTPDEGVIVLQGDGPLERADLEDLVQFLVDDLQLESQPEFATR